MSAENVLAEAMARLEHKLDLVLEQITPGPSRAVPLPALGSPKTCPVCKQNIDYQVDQINKVIVRKCGCKTGLQAPLDLEAFAPPVQAKRKDQDHGAGEDQQDRLDPDARRRLGGR